jgi:hypothetical protein
MSRFRMRIEFEIEVVDEEEFKAEARGVLTRLAEENGPVTISGASDLTSPDVRGTRLVVQSLCGLGLVGRGPL